MAIQTAEDEVKTRLRTWGREYRFQTEDEPCDRNLLYDLIRFQGRIPRSPYHGPKGRTAADEIEDIVKRFHGRCPKAATCLRFCYCDRGPMRDKAKLAHVSFATFRVYVAMGEEFVAGALIAKRVAA